ncbi:MAG TPA: LysE family translocator [Burkholderiales bacterium]|nr:LysE family translocator [Burkholderiales bacterium]
MIDITTLLFFAVAVLPLICTPGPDILFIASQGLSSGPTAAFRAVSGVLLGYSAHAVLSAAGVAAVVAASPLLFEALRWAGVAYLAYLAFQMLRSALSAGAGLRVLRSGPVSLWRGFLTSFLNPKGLLMYLALLPQFISTGSNPAIQAIILSVVFIVGCALVYGAIGLAAARASTAGVGDRARRRIEGVAGFLLAGAAVKIATQ